LIVAGRRFASSRTCAECGSNEYDSNEYDSDDYDSDDYDSHLGEPVRPGQAVRG
jgi:hypothetical protein